MRKFQLLGEPSMFFFAISIKLLIIRANATELLILPQFTTVRYAFLWWLYTLIFGNAESRGMVQPLELGTIAKGVIVD